MRRFRTLTALAIGGSLIATAACTTNPETGNQRVSRTAVGAIAGGAIGNYMDRQEAELRRQTAGTGVDVIRQGDDLLLRMPSGITFDYDRFDIKPQFEATLNEVARTLQTYNQTYVDVLGHTDTTGTAEYNQGLSVRRAQSVANYLVSHGVASARIATRGYGESAPLYSPDDTEAKRAANRRVEIKIVPVRDGDVR